MSKKRNFSWRLRHKPIKLYWFRRQSRYERNFGDEISAEIVKKLSGRKVQWADLNECEMVAVGSVLEPILAQKNPNRICVWGTGLMFDREKINYNKPDYDIHLVRGKLTARKLDLGQKTYGDPGILADILYKPSKNKKKIAIVPHYVDQNSSIIKKLSEKKEIKVINVFNPPSKVVSEIASSELVISSSLHGIITAHSFGIPAYWVELSNDVAGGGFKFKDYYSIFDREPARINIKQLRAVANKADHLISSFKPINDLAVLKKNIIKTFPKQFSE